MTRLLLLLVLSLPLLVACNERRSSGSGGGGGGGGGGEPAADAGTQTDPPPMTTDPPPPTCTDECDSAAPPQCAGDGWRSCSRGSDGCNHWNPITPCGADQYCEGGACRGESCPGGCCPVCDGTRCGSGSDGCGGSCDCGSGLVCNDVNTCCTPENGAASCNRVVGAWCGRIIECCTAPGAGDCVEWAYDMTACRAHHVTTGLDCSAPEWTSATYCAEGITRCVGDIPLVSCSDFYSGTANLPASC